jgi:hypothetical protein
VHKRTIFEFRERSVKEKTPQSFRVEHSEKLNKECFEQVQGVPHEVSVEHKE